MTQSAAAAPRHAKLSGLPAMLFLRCAAALRRRTEYRRSLSLLSQMDDVRLRDIGICRAEIEAYLRH